MKTALIVETDGDRYPKDVYLVRGLERVATMHGDNETEMKHLAKLFASAPSLLAQRDELLEALKQMLEEFETLTDSDPDWAWKADKARTAIANATAGCAK